MELIILFLVIFLVLIMNLYQLNYFKFLVKIMKEKTIETYKKIHDFLDLNEWIEISEIKKHLNLKCNSSISRYLDRLIITQDIEQKEEKTSYFNIEQKKEFIKETKMFYRKKTIKLSEKYYKVSFTLQESRDIFNKIQQIVNLNKNNVKKIGEDVLFLAKKRCFLDD